MIDPNHQPSTLSLSRVAGRIARRVGGMVDAGLRTCSWANLRYVCGLGPQSLADIWPDRGQSSLRRVPLALPEAFDFDVQVVVPVYNGARYLEACLDSVWAQQTGFRLCVTAIDDGSDDASPQILERHVRLHPDRMRVCRIAHGGLSAARNAAIDMMLAPRLLMLDADDLLPPGAVERLMQQSVATGAAFTEGSMCKFDDAGHRAEPRRHTASARATDIWGYAAGKVVRLEVFRDVEFPRGYVYEDTVYSMLLFRRFPHAATVGDVTYLYRFNGGGSLSTTRHLRRIDSYWVTLRMLDDYRRSGGIVDQAYREQLIEEARHVVQTVRPLRRFDVDRLVRRGLAEMLRSCGIDPRRLAD